MPLLRATAVAFLQCDMALFLIIVGLHGAVAVVTMSQVHVQSGATVTIPCHYTLQYRDHVKYWCWGYIWYTCSTLAQSGSLTAGGDRVAITDDPSGGVFTVTLRDLQVGDSASYWCGVEGGSAAYLYLEVTEDLPGLWVEDSTVSGEEGASLSVRCLSGDSTGGGVRKWCRSGDWQSCLAGNSSRASDRSTVLTIDNGTGTLTVMMRRLERKDTGWYWCAAGDLQIPVHITVTQRMTTVTTKKNMLVYTTDDLSRIVNSGHEDDGRQPCCGEPASAKSTLAVLRKTGVALVFLVCTAMAVWKIWQNRRARIAAEQRA
ncbi:hypothetical protein AGOR_G00173150 [Albula goreensis]|uniref:Ig-like domain-containing protein n=1 Tax=Albula goreensis TaxID=1534307 RepID=A0A8T3CUE6_9TELE|nr:hypothetical protein AGOR_G00173150 [Albula goreensis]